jgi:hypothetical protein
MLISNQTHACTGAELNWENDSWHRNVNGAVGKGGLIEVHHVRKLGNLEGKALWERHMIERNRKTMVLCGKCHDDLHAGRLGEKRVKRKPESRIQRNV